MREDYDPRPARSAQNPNRLPERRLKELRLIELGPTCFPAYSGTTAGLRAMAGKSVSPRLAKELAERKARMLKLELDERALVLRRISGRDRYALLKGVRL
jgi:hypothetical protein